jgi:hypothetical protein
VSGERIAADATALLKVLKTSPREGKDVRGKPVECCARSGYRKVA